MNKMTNKNLEIKEKRIYHRIGLKSEELFNRAERWLLAGTSTYQFTRNGFNQYSFPGAIIKSSPRSKNVYIVSKNKGTINFLERRLKNYVGSEGEK